MLSLLIAAALFAPAPALVLPPALGPIEVAWVAEPSAHDVGSWTLVEALRDELGARLSVVGGSTGHWLQDQMEIMVPAVPDDRVDVAFVADGATALREALIGAPGVMVDLDGGYDEFGNIEATPPVTVGGRSYPFGRVMYGDGGPDEDRDRFVARLRDDGVQEPFSVDTSWLCVGHVDELVTFLPDPLAPQGFVALIPDPEAGLRVLDRVDSTQPLRRYAAVPGEAPRGPSTAAELAENPWNRLYNSAIATGPMARLRRTLRDELGLADREIVGLPMLFELEPDDPLCGAVGLVPNPVNLLLVDGSDGGWTALVADPWFRGVDAPLSGDVFANEILSRIGHLVRVRFVDTWEGYHLLGGEVHCAVGVRRGRPSPSGASPPGASAATGRGRD